MEARCRQPEKKMTTSTPSFLVGVEVTSEGERRLDQLGIFPQWETMAGVPGKASPGFSKLVPKLLFRLAPTSLCPVRKQTPSDFTLPEPC